MDENDKDKLLATIKAFIDNPKEDGIDTWCEVTHKDIHELAGIVREIIDAHFPRDCDGSTPIEFDLINRTKFEPRFVELVPYRHDVKDVMDYIRPIAGNASMATQKLSDALRLLERG